MALFILLGALFVLFSRCREIEFKIDLDEVIKKSNAIEEEMFKYFGDTGQKYRTKYRSLVFNLKDQKNKVCCKITMLTSR